MAPSLHVGAASVARRDISPGGIAGAVIGSVIGVGILSLVLGFFFFRWRRLVRQSKGHHQPETAELHSHRRVSLHGTGFQQGDVAATPGDRPPSMKSERSERAISFLGDSTELQQSPVGASNLEYQSQQNEYTYQPFPGQSAAGQSIDQTIPRRTTEPAIGDQMQIPLDHASTAPGGYPNDYYDPTIPMDSDPEERVMKPPTKEMTDMYKAQVKEAHEYRHRHRSENSKQGSGSSARRLFNFKRKRSQNSEDPSSAVSTEFPYFPSFWNMSGGSASRVDSESQSANASGSGGQFFAEPEQLGPQQAKPLASSTQPDKKRAKQQEDEAMDDATSRGIAPLQTASRQDSQLPSSAIPLSSSVSPTDLWGQPQPTPLVVSTLIEEAQPGANLDSPAIPEPMEPELDQMSSPGMRSTSRSPQPDAGSFVHPMAVMNPSTNAEKAAFNAYELTHSASPPSFDNPLPSPPEMNDQLHDEDADESMDDSDDMDEDDYMDTSDPAPRIDSYSLAVPGMLTVQQSSQPVLAEGFNSHPTQIMTPNTQITPSPTPSPYPANGGVIKLEPGSPEDMDEASSVHQCAECGRTFDQIHKLNHHKRYHDRKHACTFEGCDKKFGTKTHLDRHINDKHLKSKAFHCTEPSCPYYKGGKAFPRKDNWRRHMQNKHKMSPPSDHEYSEYVEAQAG